MGLNDIVLRITGKSDVKTAAMQAKRDLDGAFSLKGMMGSQSDMRGVRALIRGGIVGMAKYAFEEGFSIGRSLADGISEALESKKGVFAHFWDKLTGYDKIEKKNAEQFTKDITAQSSQGVKANADRNADIASGVRSRDARASQQVDVANSYAAAATTIANAWAEADAERMNAIDQAAVAQQSAEDNLRDKINETRRAIELRTASVKDQVDVAADLEAKIKKAKASMNATNTGNADDDAIIRKGWQDQIDANEKIKSQADELAQKLRAEKAVLTNNLLAQTATFNALQKQNDIRMMALSIEQFISDEKTKQSALASESMAKLKNQNAIRQAELTGYAQYLDALKSGVSEAEAALEARKAELGVLTQARALAKQNGQTGKVEELDKEIAQSKLLGRIETDNLNTLRLTSAALDKQAQTSARIAGLQALQNMPGGRGEGTPRGLMEGILGIVDPKSGKARPRTVSDLPLEQQMEMLRNPELNRQIRGNLKKGGLVLSREDRQVAEYNKALARGQTPEQLKNMAGAKIAKLRIEAEGVAKNDMELKIMQLAELEKVVVQMKILNRVFEKAP